MIDLRWSQSQLRMVPAYEVPAQGFARPLQPASNTSSLHSGRPSEPGLVGHIGSPGPLFKSFQFGPLGPDDAEHRMVASEADSDSSFVLSDPISQAGHSRRRKQPLHQVYTGRVDKGSGRQTASATLTSNPSILSLAPRESLTGQLSTIISFVRTLEHQVEQLPPHGETTTRNFLRNQANNLSKELVAIAKALETVVDDASSSVASAGSVGGELTETDLTTMLSQEGPPMGLHPGTQY